MIFQNSLAISGTIFGGTAGGAEGETGREGGGVEMEARVEVEGGQGEAREGDRQEGRGGGGVWEPSKAEPPRDPPE